LLLPSTVDAQIPQDKQKMERKVNFFLWYLSIYW